MTRAPAAMAGSGVMRADPAAHLARAFTFALLLMLAFAVIGVQLVRLALKGQNELRVSMSRALAESVWRPDIVDRHGRLLATDIEAPTLYADPALILDPDEVAEKLSQIFPDLDAGELRRTLSDRNRRFVRLRRGLSPATAQRVHAMGLPGLAFRGEPKRVYPSGRLAGHVLGNVNGDNRGTAGIERYIDEAMGLEPSVANSGPKRPVRLTLDIAAQHALEAELRSAVRRFAAAGASGVIMDVETGEILAAASSPEIDPANRLQALDQSRLDKVADGVYELGSVFKAITVASGLEAGIVTLDKVYDVRTPLRVGPYIVRDLHPAGRPLTVGEIFVLSSNIGAGMIGLDLGAERQRAFLSKLGLLDALRTEAGPVAAPKLPTRWGRAETITISYGHGLAVAPLQFAAAAATLVNGGYRVVPKLTLSEGPQSSERERLISAQTSTAIRSLMRRNVVAPNGTGRRAEVPGYEVGGKTGTAETAARGGYREKAVIASFLAAFPMSAPRYLVFVTLHEPKATDETRQQITAGVNAAPVAGQIIARVAPILGLLPSDTTRAASAPSEAQPR